MKSTTTANEHANKEYACLLAFDVKIMPDAETYANENGIQIFTARIIYHLFDEFTEYVEKCRNERKADKGGKAVFPCILQVSYSIIRRNLGLNFFLSCIKMVPDACFHTTNPIVIGVNVVEGVLKTGTPLCVPDREVSTFMIKLIFFLLFAIESEIGYCTINRS